MEVAEMQFLGTVSGYKMMDHKCDEDGTEL
jgi:hypothetical protein